MTSDIQDYISEILFIPKELALEQFNGSLRLSNLVFDIDNCEKLICPLVRGRDAGDQTFLSWLIGSGHCCLLLYPPQSLTRDQTQAQEAQIN